MKKPPAWTTANPLWAEQIIAGTSIMPRLPLFPLQVNKAREIFQDLRIVDAPGSPTFREVCRDWLFEFTDSIFGTYDEETGRRLIREFFLLISKKNSKSTGAGGIMLTALMRNWRKSAEFLILAPTIEVAKNSFFPTRDMIKADPELDEILHVQEHYRTITHRVTGATLSVVAADSNTVGGKKAVGVLIDELWLFGKQQNAEAMLREATGGLASRPEGFTIYLSTQSDDAPAGIFAQKLKYARDVRDGIVKNNRFLPILYEFPDALIKNKAYMKKDMFYVTNPNLGASVDEEFLNEEFDKAVNAGQDSLIGFLAKHLNVEIGLALKSDRWVGADYFEATTDKTITLERIIAECELVVVGIDGGGLDDLLGLAVLGRHKITRDWMLWGHAWAHESVYQRRQDIVTKLRDFEADGDLTKVENVGDDVEQVADIVERIELAGLLPPKMAVGVDQAGIDTIVEAITQRDIDIARIGGVPQGWKLTNAIKTAERRMASGTFRHNGSRLLAWNFSNARVEPKGNAIVITKQISGNAKIDVLMAFLDSVVAMGQNPEAGQQLKHAILQRGGFA